MRERDKNIENGHGDTETRRKTRERIRTGFFAQRHREDEEDQEDEGDEEE